MFGAAFSKKPETYNPAYYWSEDESIMKGILKIFYIRQPRILKQSLLHTSDKANGFTKHDWGKNKDKVAYRDLEDNIIRIVARVTEKKLREL